jgi:hypothetical protein
MKKLFMMLFIAAFAFALAPGLFSPALAGEKTAASKAACCATSMDCSKCQKECEKTLSYFKKKGGKYTEAKNIQILEDCISSCKASAEFQSRKSANSSKIMAVCSEICKQCAQMCKDMNDPKLADCIKSCLECATCCEKGHDK